MSLKHAVVKFLNHPRLYISFNFYGYPISTEAFKEVAKAIGSDEITVGKSSIPGWAYYDPTSKTLTLAGIKHDNYRFGALIIHECVHAFHHLQAHHDLQKYKNILLVADEGCAYIAQGIFLHHYGEAFEGYGHPVDDMALFYTLDNVVKSKGKASTPGRETVKRFIRWLSSLSVDERSGPAYDAKSRREYQ